MKIKSAHSTRRTVQAAVDDLRQNLSDVQTSVVLYFASTSYAPAALSETMQKAFAGATVFGCSTAGEIASGLMLKNSIVAMAFTKAAIKSLKVMLVEQVGDKKGLKERVVGAMNSFNKSLGVTSLKLDPKRFVGLILIDGLSLAEEAVMETLGDLTDVSFVGGSAGDDLKFSKTYVFANGKDYANAALLAMVEPATSFEVIKTQSFCLLGKSLLATEVEEATRTVVQFNGKSAASAYAQALGVPVAAVSESFMNNPLGLMIEDEPFVRSPQRVENGSMVFYCNIKEGMELAVLESTDMIKDTRAAIEKAKNGLGGISGVVNFNCILRTLDLEKHGLLDDYGKVFSGVPTVGFSTYGEEYIRHINQTATMLVFG